MNYLPSHSILPKKTEGVLAMTEQRKVWVRWIASMDRWEVGHYWKGYKGAFRFYSWEINGRRYGFTRENKAIAEQFADHLRGLMLPDPITGVVRYDPTKFSKVKRSRYALSKWSKLWIKDYEGKAKTKDVTPEYVEILRGYIDHHINPVLGVVSVYDIDSMEIKAFYHDLSDKGLSKKHVQNVMDCLKRMLKNASEDLQGLDMPKFPQYREKRVNKVHKTHCRQIRREMTNQELDNWFAENVMGWSEYQAKGGLYPGLYWVTYLSDCGEVTIKKDDWQPTIDIKQAFECVEKMIAEHDYWPTLVYKTTRHYTKEEGVKWVARFRCVRGGIRKDLIDSNDTPALAICLAIKKAVELNGGK